MARGGGNIFLNLITSGKNELSSFDETIRYIILNVSLFLGGVFLVVFGFSVYFEGYALRSLLDFGEGVLCFTSLALLRTKIPLKIPGSITIACFGILCGTFLFSGDIHGVVSLWIYIFPLMAIFILGLQMGTIYSILLFCAILAATLIPGLAAQSYNIDAASRFIAVYILVGVLTVVYEQTKLVKDRRVELLTHELRVERDVISAMKDNLKAGVFLMDKNHIIQGAYSRPLEGILGTDEIEGKKLTTFLASSLKVKERETLDDYFGMVINRQFDAKMLDEINPISELTYIDDINHEQKILRTAFSAVDMGLNDFYILGSIEDVSAAKELERQLAEEASRREEEMRALFQVIQVDPRVFGDFLEDTEYEFERINDTLKNKDLSARDAMVDIYQSVHAIKSNALILGMDNFSAKLHELENVIKQYRDNVEVGFEDVLHVTVEIERIMKEKDKFRATIDKIEAFRVTTGDNRRQDRYVLVETLTKACEKAAAAQEKQVKFTIEELDGTVLEKGPRRLIKEVLTQLVRNSVYHGIEHPEERRKKGKDAEGTIRLSIVRQEGRIHLKLTDDGKGLDFNKIREKALNLKLLSQKDASKNQLLQVIFSPGFSTAETADLHAGRGIGLNLVRERIRDMRGSIKLSSEADKGTVFNIFIPLDEAAESKAS